MITSVEEHGIYAPLVEIAQLAARGHWTPQGRQMTAIGWIVGIRSSAEHTPELITLDPVTGVDAPLGRDIVANVTCVKTSIPEGQMTAVIARFVKLRSLKVYPHPKGRYAFTLVLEIGDLIFLAEIELRRKKVA